MTDAELLRYSRQIMLDGFGIAAQQRLLAARVLIVGLGGLGSPVALYLAAAGVGELILADHDRVDLSNLQRQILHDTRRIGQFKADSAVTALRDLNPQVRPRPLRRRIDAAALAECLDGCDLVVDASDNFATRFLINRACVSAGVPLVSGAAVRMEGQVAVFPGQPGGPCYQCLYPPDGHTEDSCVNNGVLAPVVGIIGSVQACEAIKVLTGYGEPLFGRLLLLDALRMQWRELRIKPDPACPICGTANRAPANS